MMPTIGCPITMGPGEFVRAIERDQTRRPFPVVGLEAVGEAESGALRDRNSWEPHRSQQTAGPLNVLDFLR